MRLQVMFVGLSLALLVVTGTAWAVPVEQVIPYQKQLTASPGNGYVSLTFSLWTDSTVGAGSRAWSEIKSIVCSSATRAISTKLGESANLSAVDFSQQLYVQVERTSDNVVLGARDKLVIAPYALWSATGNVGPQGPAGSQGPAGIKGEKGEKGDTGLQGPTGVYAPPTLFLPVNFAASASWQYPLTRTATNTTVLTSGNYTIPDGVNFITIEAVGGSGGGAGYLSSYGAGGGSGEYSGTFLAVTPGSAITIQYGAAGSGGNIGSNGGNGGDTIVTYKSFTYITAHGGQGGYLANNGYGQLIIPVGGAGGSGSTDLQHIPGVAGDGVSIYSNPTRGGGGGNGANPTNITTNVGGSGGNYASPGSPGNAGAVAISYILNP